MELNSVQLLIGIAVLVLGPTSGVWIDIRRQVSHMVKQTDNDRAFMRELSTKVAENSEHIAVLLERTGKEEA